MYIFFETLSFKQKIISGFAILSSILILGMGYMLFEFTHVASLGTAIIERHQPVTNTASKALKLTQSASNQLHQYLLTDGIASLDEYPAVLNRLQDTIRTLQEYAVDQALMIDRQQLERSISIVDEINQHTVDIVELGRNYEQNHPIITSASSLLNPLALEYLGLINQIIDNNAYADFPMEALLLLANMRHSWSQMMSNLRVSLATRTINEIDNVTVYIDVNREQTERLRAMGLDLGFEGIDELEFIRDEYLTNLDTVINEFSSSIWRRDAHLMATIVMPLYIELESYINNIAKIQLVITEAAGTVLTTELTNARYVFIALISIGLAFAFFIAVFITQSLRKPLQKLVTATKAVAMGNLDTKIQTTGHDEIAQLITSFNNMVDNLAQTRAALTSALQEAEKASDAKSHFLSSMSHELRTPLNAILGFAQLLEMDLNKKHAAGQPVATHLNYAQKIIKAGHHLLKLINSVLDLSRIEEGHLNLKMQAVAVHEVVLECIGQIEAGLASKGNIRLVDRTAELNTMVWADYLRLCQVLSNLVSNAVKYNCDDGSVIIEASVKDNLLRLSVSDTGAGISEPDIRKLFDPFERLSFSHGSVEGTGIGLTVTRQLVEAMGGTIGVDSNIGEGSTFWVELPVCNTEPETLTAAKSTGSCQVQPTIDITPVAKRKVLYIEDNLESAQLVVDALDRAETYEVKTALTAEEGFSIAKAQHQDIILMDINLPGIDGITALRQLRDLEHTSHIPVIAVSARAMDAEIRAGRAAGFDDYLTKPIDIAQLYTVINRF